MRRAMAANVGAYVANGVALVLTARALGASGRGLYAALLAWAHVTAGGTNLSLGPALAHAAANGADRSWLLRRFALDLALLSTVGAVVMVVLLRGPLRSFAVNPLIGWLVVALIPSLVVCDWSTCLLQGMGSTTVYSLTRFSPSALNLALLVGVSAVEGLTLTRAVICFWVANQLTAAGVMTWLTLNSRGSERAQIRPRWTELWRFGAKAHVGTLASTLNARLDLLLVSLLLSAAGTGRYSVAVSMTVPIAVVGTSIGAARFAEVARSASDDISTLLRRVWRQMVALTLLASVAGVVASMTMTVPVFGDGFRGSRVPAVILALGTGGLGAMYLSTSILQARGRPAVASRWYMLAAAVSGATLVVLVPLFGITGAAISSMVTYLAVGIGMARASLVPDDESVAIVSAAPGPTPLVQRP